MQEPLLARKATREQRFKVKTLVIWCNGQANLALQLWRKYWCWGSTHQGSDLVSLPQVRDCSQNLHKNETDLVWLVDYPGSYQTISMFLLTTRLRYRPFHAMQLPCLLELRLHAFCSICRSFLIFRNFTTFVIFDDVATFCISIIVAIFCDVDSFGNFCISQTRTLFPKRSNAYLESLTDRNAALYSPIDNGQPISRSPSTL